MDAAAAAADATVSISIASATQEQKHQTAVLLMSEAMMQETPGLTHVLTYADRP